MKVPGSIQPAQAAPPSESALLIALAEMEKQGRFASAASSLPTKNNVVDLKDRR